MEQRADVDASTRAPVRVNDTETDRTTENEAASGRLRGSVASAIVVIASAVMVFGSTQEWATFSGGALMSLIDRSGIELGYGVVTFLCGVGVGLIGLRAAADGGVAQYRGWAVLLSLVALATVLVAFAALVLNVGEMYSDFGGLLSHGEALYAVGIAAATGAIAAWRLQLPKAA